MIQPLNQCWKRAVVLSLWETLFYGIILSEWNFQNIFWPMFERCFFVVPSATYLEIILSNKNIVHLIRDPSALIFTYSGSIWGVWPTTAAWLSHVSVMFNINVWQNFRTKTACPREKTQARTQIVLQQLEERRIYFRLCANANILTVLVGVRHVRSDSTESKIRGSNRCYGCEVVEYVNKA